MLSNEAEMLRKSIENLINAKLRDLLRPGGADRLAAHRVTGVASWDVREAEKNLDRTLAELLPAGGGNNNRDEGEHHAAPETRTRRQHRMAV
jgi:hypothetical protein